MTNGAAEVKSPDLIHVTTWGQHLLSRLWLFFCFILQHAEVPEPQRGVVGGARQAEPVADEQAHSPEAGPESDTLAASQ